MDVTFNSKTRGKRKHMCSMGDFSVSPPPPIDDECTTPTTNSKPQTPSHQCVDCHKSFKTGFALGGHRSASLICGNNIKKETKVKSERIKRKRAKRKCKNKDGSQRAPRLLLDDALQDTELQTGWSDIRKRAWGKKHTEGHFYRFNISGEAQKKGKWSSQEHDRFIKRVEEVGVNAGW
eukprot:236702_1